MAPLGSDQLTVPRKNGRWRHDGREPREEATTQCLALCCEPAPLVVGQVQPAAFQLFFENAILLEEVVDLALQVLVHPASEGGKDEPKEHEVAEHGRILACSGSAGKLLFLSAFE